VEVENDHWTTKFPEKVPVALAVVAVVASEVNSVECAEVQWILGMRGCTGQQSAPSMEV